jgi:hypothetical protein
VAIKKNGFQLVRMTDVRQAPTGSPCLPDVHEFDPRLYTGEPVYNGALIRHAGRWVQTLRIGPNSGTRTMIGWLDDELRPTGPFRNVSTPESAKEDMRLFLHRGQLWGSYMDLARDRAGKVCHVDVNVCRFAPDLSVEEEFKPRVPGQWVWEKNWLFWSGEGSIHFVYAIDPVHTIYRWEPGSAVQIAGRTEVKTGWNETLRGGAPPVFHGGRYVALFHAGNPSRRIGSYQFEAKAPFRVVRVGPEPILHRPGPEWGCVYAISLVEAGGHLYISYGEDDRRLIVRRWI